MVTKTANTGCKISQGKGKNSPRKRALAQSADATLRLGLATWDVCTYPEGKDNFPVGGISWYEAAAYAKFVGKSLPSILHVNRAAYRWLAARIIERSNFCGSGPVLGARKQGVSFYGSYDMGGNVR